MQLLLRCPSCGKYTLESLCPNCTIMTINPDPPKFSIQDKYGSYRRKMKKLKREGNAGSQDNMNGRSGR